MKKILAVLFFFCAFSVFAQNEQLAANYFEKGDFEKAIVAYEELIAKQPNNYLFTQRIIECYQQLSQFEKAHALLIKRLEKNKQPNLYIEIGYNYQLQNDVKNASKNYDLAVEIGRAHV